MLQDLLNDGRKQAAEHEMEIQGLLQSMSTREQASQVSANAEPDRDPALHSWSADRKCLELLTWACSLHSLLGSSYISLNEIV